MNARRTFEDDPGNALGSFLRARRAQVSPEVHGLAPVEGRRVSGLRREEVAELADVSTDYYIRLEQGRDRHPSPSVLDALARVLCLDGPARVHLTRLTSGGLGSDSSEDDRAPVGRELVELIDQWTEQACLVLSPYRDVLAANSLATAINPIFRVGSNLMREVFLDPDAHKRYPDWKPVAEQGVAALRAAVGANRVDPVRDALVRDLSTGSPEFARLWARHDAREKPRGRQRFWNPVVGVIDLLYEPFVVTPEEGRVMYVFFAEEGSPAQHQLRLLARNIAGMPAIADNEPDVGVCE